MDTWSAPWCDKGGLIWIKCENPYGYHFCCVGVTEDDAVVYYVSPRTPSPQGFKYAKWYVYVYQGRCVPGEYSTPCEAMAVIRRFYEDRLSGRYYKSEWVGNGKGGKHRTVSLPDDFEGRHEREWPGR